MGKRKSSKKQVSKPKEVLSTTFKCLFCNHEKSITVKIDKQAMFGHLSCKVCGQKFTTPINNLSAAVDVYCDWVDACEEARTKQAPKKIKVARPPSPEPERRGSGSGSAGGGSAPRDRYDLDDDDDEDDLGRALDNKAKRSKRNSYDDDESDEDADRERHRKQARHAYDDESDDE